jgi:hypothetical protein
MSTAYSRFAWNDGFMSTPTSTSQKKRKYARNRTATATTERQQPHKRIKTSLRHITFIQALAPFLDMPISVQRRHPLNSTARRILRMERSEQRNKSSVKLREIPNRTQLDQSRVPKRERHYILTTKNNQQSSYKNGEEMNTHTKNGTDGSTKSCNASHSSSPQSSHPQAGTTHILHVQV